MDDLLALGSVLMKHHVAFVAVLIHMQTNLKYNYHIVQTDACKHATCVAFCNVWNYFISKTSTHNRKDKLTIYTKRKLHLKKK